LACLLAGLLVGSWLVDQHLSWFVCSDGQSVECLVWTGCLVGQSNDQSVGWSVDWLIDWLVGCSAGWLPGWLIDRLVGCSVGRSEADWLVN
jgi:hypothetical protein